MGISRRIGLVSLDGRVHLLVGDGLGLEEFADSRRWISRLRSLMRRLSATSHCFGRVLRSLKNDLAQASRKIVFF